MQNEAFWSLLEQIRAWNEDHMLGAMRMDEIEDLKMKIPTWARFPSWSRKIPNEDGILAKLGFLVEIGILVEIGFLVELGNLEDWSFLLKQGFLLEVGNVNPNWPQVAATKKFSKSKKEMNSKMKEDETCLPNARGNPKPLLDTRLDGSRTFLLLAVSLGQFLADLGF